MGCIAKERSQGLEILSTPDILAQRWLGRIVPIVFGPHENWGLTLLVGERRVDLGRCRVAARIGCVFCCLGCSAEMATKAGLYGAS